MAIDTNYRLNSLPASSDAVQPRSLEALEREITELAAQLNAVTGRWLSSLREFDEREGWIGTGLQSCAHWLSWKCGITLGAAREKLRVAHAMKELPLVSAALARGQLSYSKARAITRIADASTESFLLQAGLNRTTDQLEKLVRSWRRTERVNEAERAARQHEGRALRHYFDDEGCVVIEVRLPAEQGALALKAIEAALDERAEARWQAREKVSAETSSPEAGGSKEGFAAQRADALVRVAESYLANGSKALAGGERYQVVVHVDDSVLATASEGRCELEDGPWIAAETARRIACDASVVEMHVDGNGKPLDAGRRTRSIPPALRRALRARDDGCRFPGCTRKRFTDGHHVVHWATGGATKLGNLVSLCRRHHRLVHEGGFGVRRLDDGEFVFARPDGVVIPEAPQFPEVVQR